MQQKCPSSTGYTPFYLLHGRQAILPVDIQYGTSHSHQATSQTEYVTELNQRLLSAFELVHETAGMQHERQKEYYDTKAISDPRAVGDLVWVLNPKVPKNSSKKLFHPSFRVIKKLSECTYRVQKLEGRKQRQVVHFNRLKPCPKDIRLGHGSGQVPPVNHHRTKYTSSPTSNEQTLLPPIVTNLELVDDDEDHLVNENHTGAGDSTHTLDSQPSTETKRYPTHHYRPPSRLQDYVKS